MSEKLQPKLENIERLDLNTESKHNLERIKHRAESHESGKHEIDKIQRTVERHAISGKEFSIGEQEQPVNQPAFGIQREIKAEAYIRTLKKIRKQLNAPERILSGIVHRPLVDKLSDVSGKTVARPSGILGGGIISFTGSITLLYLAKHYGFRYNFFVFILLFAGGFILGMTLELALRLLFRRRSIL